MPWRPSYPGEIPTLGWHVLDWMREMLAAPDRAEYEPFVPTPEQARFILRLYEIDWASGKRRYRRAVISRAKGWGKSPLLAAIGAAEGLAEVVFDGWDADGQPVGRPWLDLRTPLVQFAATSEDQTKNAWAPLLEMLREGPVIDYYDGLEPLETFVNLPKGRMEQVTAAASSREGNRPVFAVMDQTESWLPNNGGIALAATMRRNLGKTGGCSVESPNAFKPGLGSVAERSAEYANQIQSGNVKDTGLLYDHQEAPPETDMTDRASLLAGLAVAYGDSAEPAGGWVDLERIVAEIWDPATDPQDARAFYLGQITHASDSWLSSPEYSAIADPLSLPVASDAITLGFDGSRHRSYGVTDATALVGVRLEDSLIFPIGIWEQPDNVKDWWPDIAEIDAAVAEAHQRYRVVGFYGDPAADWRSIVAGWEARYGADYEVSSTRDHPIEWWMGGQNAVKTVRATGALHSAIVHRQARHNGSARMRAHFLNARRREHRSGIMIAKDFPDSPRKIDAAVAAILGWQCHLDARAAGVSTAPPQRSKRLVRF